MPDERLWGVLEAGAVSVGDAAPDFELPALIAGVKKKLRLSAYRGQKSVVLAFYPFNWQEASARQMADYQAQRPRMLANNAETVGITTDSIMNTTAWEREIGPLEFPLCVDFWPHGEVATRYGVLRESGVGAGASERAIFIVDRGGRVAFRKIYAPDEVPLVDDVFSALGKL
jgi:peroxiredoxin